MFDLLSLRFKICILICLSKFDLLVNFDKSITRTDLLDKSDLIFIFYGL